MTNTKNEITLVSAVSVSDRVELRSVRILACDCRQKPKCPTRRKWFGINHTSRFEVDQEQKAIGVFIKFVLNAFGEGSRKSAQDAFLTIEATFHLLYSINSLKDLDDRAIKSFAELNGIYNAWPYWREFVQNITGRMELPTLTVPVFRLTKPSSKIATNEEGEAPVAITKNKSRKQSSNLHSKTRAE